MIVDHGTIISGGADVEDVPTRIYEADARRAALHSSTFQFRVEIELMTPVMNFEGAEPVGDPYGIVVGGREVRALNPVMNRLHRLTETA